MSETHLDPALFAEGPVRDARFQVCQLWSEMANEGGASLGGAGRKNIWKATWKMIKEHPLTGVGFNGYWAAIPQYHSASGRITPQQAHNDYLQTLADGGIAGGLLGLSFLILLFGRGFARRATDDKFRSGVATGALAGCFAVLVHSAFDFTLHTTANALLFLVLAAMATLDRRVDEGSTHRRRRRHRSNTTAGVESPAVAAEVPPLTEAKPA